MLPLAPGRFSITTDQPRFSLRLCASMRAEMSGAPPGGMVTSTRIGRFGKGACASAAVPISETAAMAAANNVDLNVIASPSSQACAFYRPRVAVPGDIIP
jgi:hypothetical protein